MNFSQKIRIMIVDDHAVVRSGLARFLLAYPDFELVGEASNGALAIQLCGHRQPDVVLMDLMMPEMDGVTAIRQIHQQHPHIKVLALTSFIDDNLVHGVLQAGAVGYLLKNVTADELAQAIRNAHTGRMTLASEATEALAHSLYTPPVSDNQLTQRELEVLALVVQGLSNQEIADYLVVSLGTVKFHMGNIFNKLGVQSRVEAVTLALQRKLV